MDILTNIEKYISENNTTFKIKDEVNEHGNSQTIVNPIDAQIAVEQMLARPKHNAVNKAKKKKLTQIVKASRKKNRK